MHEWSSRETSSRSLDLPAKDIRSPARHIAFTPFAPRLTEFWVLGTIIVLFGLFTPSTLLTQLTVTTTLNDGAATGRIALGLIPTLLAGILDLSVAYVAGFATVLITELNVNSLITTLGVGTVALGITL